MITSVEPGLYYPGKGGCRIEDVVAVTKDGHDNLTSFSKENWIL
jgi:Xaa-Pro aminopeptidase